MNGANRKPGRADGGKASRPTPAPERYAARTAVPHGPPALQEAGAMTQTTRDERRIP